MKEELRSGLLLFKRYCKAFNLQPILDKGMLKAWDDVRGAMIAAAFNEADMPPIVWVDGDGSIWIEQDEDLISPNEPAVAKIEPSLLEVAIANRKRIHPVAA